MALHFKKSDQVLLCLILLTSSHILFVTCTEFEVGGEDGWVVPKSQEMYNQWASKNRFQVDDALRFKYKKDSVLLVTEEDYNNCTSYSPLFYSNNGDTVFKFNHSGVFFFISGVPGHCESGQRMIIKVLVLEIVLPPQPAASENATTELHHKGGATDITAITKTTMALFLLSFISWFAF